MIKPKRISLQDIQRASWDAKWWRGATTKAKLLWFYLLSWPRHDSSPAPGLLFLRLVQIGYEMGWAEHEVPSIVNELVQAQQISVDIENHLILVPALIECGLPDNRNMAKAALRDYLVYPDCALRDDAIRYFAELSSSLGGGFKSVVEDFTQEFSATEQAT